MTNFANGRDPLDELWNVILSRHWKYLETEESLEKIDERKKLEGYFKEFLSVVPHDRKFYLPETGHVLKKTVLEMKDFSGYKGAIGFESISQYANNLITKPWRKEYKTIKLYSGIFQHEIRNNLIDAEKLFEEMGYTMLPNQTLVLEGPICPDQVTNVSRDAMAAYVECQIMKQVNSEITAMGLATSWIEIFNYREFHIGDSSQTIKGLALHIQSRNTRKVQDYGLSGPMPPLPHHVQHQQQQSTMCNSHCSVHPLAAHNQAPYSYYNNQSFNLPCPMQMQQSNNYQQNYQSSALPPPPNSYYYEDQQNQHHLPHSKSLDQYDNGGNKVNGGVQHQHRHSLDHSITNNYKMNQQIVPNPHQHHHQLQQQQLQQQQQQQQQQMPYDCVDSCGYNAYNNHPYNHPYNQPNNRFPLPFNLSSDLGALSAPPPPPPPTMRDPEQYYNGNPMTMQYFQHHPLMAHQIQIPTSVTDYHSSHQQKGGYDMSDNSSPAMADNELINFETEPQRTRPMEVKLRSSLKKNVDSMNYSGAVKSSRKSPQHENYNDNYNDDKEQSGSLNHRPTGAKNNNEIKNKDGIGNYHSWDYVYKNLEEQGCNKDQGERADEIAAQIQMQNLQLNNTGPPKLYPKSNGNAHRMQDTNNKPSSISDNHNLNHNSNNFVNNKSPPSRRNKSTTSNGGGDKTTKENHSTTMTRSNGSANANNNKNNTSTLGRQKQSVNDKTTNKQSTVEWNCPHCTFINTDAKRICEMCAKSKDFYAEPDKPAKATATCV